MQQLLELKFDDGISLNGVVHANRHRLFILFHKLYFRGVMFFSLLYIDPGSGSMLIQMIVAGALGALFFFKNIWYQIKSFFVRNKKEEPEDYT